MGGEDKMRSKIEAYGHQEFNNDEVKDNVKSNLDSGKDVLGRSEFYYVIDESQLPKYLLDNKQKYKKFFR